MTLIECMAKFLLFFILTLTIPLKAQEYNLIVNPGFERTEATGRVEGWYMPPSTNYHHDEAGPFGEPHSGKKMAGICISNYMFSEAMITFLKDTLRAGETYRIRFYARAVPRTEDCYNYFAADEIQIYFPEEPIPILPDKPLKAEERRMVRFSLANQDSTQRKEWQVFEGDYVAVGGEHLMAVGYFKRFDNEKPIVRNSTGAPKKNKKKRIKRRNKVTVNGNPIHGYYAEGVPAFRVRYYFDDFALLTDSVPALSGMMKSPKEIEAGDTLILEDIPFEFDKSDLLAESIPVLDSVVRILYQHPQFTVRIVAHTDSLGSADYNLTLSEERAMAVRDYLISKGIDRQRLKAEGKGEAQPRANNSSEAGRALNRRVEFYFDRP